MTTLMAEPETNIWMQAVHLGGEPRKQSEGGKEARLINTTYTIKAGYHCGKWASFPLGIHKGPYIPDHHRRETTSCGGHGPCCLPAPRSRLSGHRYTRKMHYPVEVQLSSLSQCNKTSLISNYTLFSIFLLNIPLFPFELVLASVHSLMSNKIFNVSISIWATRFHPFWKISFNRSGAHNEIRNRFTCQSQVNTVHGEVCLVCS